MDKPSYELIERPGELLIRVRWLSVPATAVLLVGLLGLWSLVIQTKSSLAVTLALLVATALPAIFVGFNNSWLSIKPNLLTIYNGPMPILQGRHSVDPILIDELYTSMFVSTGRSGRAEHWSLMATAEQKPITILDALPSEADAVNVARVLIPRLNESRPTWRVPVVLR